MKQEILAASRTVKGMLFSDRLHCMGHGVCVSEHVVRGHQRRDNGGILKVDVRSLLSIVSYSNGVIY